MAKQRRRPTFSLAAFARSWGGALAGLALAIQCFIIQPHVDGLAFLAPAQVEATTAASDQANQHAPITCVICEAAAVSRTGIIAAPPAIALVETTLYLANPAPALPIVEARPTLPWQSRAPPSFA